MPRARNLKPGFFKDAKVVACSFEARLLFQGLWCLADYKGRLKYVPIEIKMEVFPADQIDVEARMAELEENGLIQIYRDHSGTTLVQVLGFSKHQNPHVNERQDKDKNPLPHLPGPEEVIVEAEESEQEKPDTEQRVKSALVVLREYSESDPADSLNLIPSYLLRKTPSDPPAGDPPKGLSKIPPAEKPKRKHKLPADFLLTDFRKAQAVKYWLSHDRPDLVADDEFEKFEANHRSKGTAMLDWDAAWKTWYCNAVKFNPPPRGQGHGPTAKELERQRLREATSGATRNDW